MDAQTLTAWEMWDNNEDRLINIESDLECALNDTDCEMRGAEESIEEMEQEIAALREKIEGYKLRRSRLAKQYDAAQIALHNHRQLEPEQD